MGNLEVYICFQFNVDIIDVRYYQCIVVDIIIPFLTKLAIFKSLGAVGGVLVKIKYINSSSLKLMDDSANKRLKFTSTCIFSRKKRSLLA